MIYIDVGLVLIYIGLVLLIFVLLAWALFG